MSSEMETLPFALAVGAVAVAAIGAVAFGDGLGSGFSEIATGVIILGFVGTVIMMGISTGTSR